MPPGEGLLWGGLDVSPNGDRIFVTNRDTNRIYTFTFPCVGQGDMDGDGFEGDCDCDDTNPGCYGDCDTDADGDGFCVRADCDDGDPNNWMSCTTCEDLDEDGHFNNCDQYVTIDGPDCSDDDENNWDRCSTCRDMDGDAFFIQCNDYVTLEGPDCWDAWVDCTDNCTDGDGDGFPACGGVDCDDTNEHCTADCTDTDNDGFCAGEGQDCDDGIASCTDACIDSDGDGHLACHDDCDDTLATCTTDCTDGDGDGLAACAGDVDDANPLCSVDPLDVDGDGVCFNFDCDDTNPLNCGPLCPTRLSPDLIAGGRIVQASVSPDGSRAVYLADQQANEVFELFSVDVDGGEPVRLNGALVSGGDVEDYRISDDGAWVVYQADQDSDEVQELYSVPIAGGVPVRLIAGLVPDGNVLSFEISPDGSRVVYRADQEINGVVELYSVRLDGTDPQKLNAPLLSAGDVLANFGVSPDGSWVVYLAKRGDVELYSVPTAGGTAVTLAGSSAFRGDVVSATISPDSSRVVYARYSNNNNSSTRLYAVPIGGGARVPLSTGTGPLRTYAVPPDGGDVVFIADDGRNKLFRTPIGGGDPVQLSDHSGPVDVTSFESAADGSVVVYALQSTSSERLYAVSRSGGAPIALTDPSDIRAYAISFDGSRVVFSRAEGSPVQTIETYSVPISGGTPVHLARSSQWQIAPDSAAVVFDLYGPHRLEIVPIDGGEPIRLDSLSVEEWIVRVGFAAGGDRFLFLESDSHGGRGLYSVALPFDNDADGAFAACDCDDAKTHCRDDCTDGDSDGYCVDQDCDDSRVGCSTDCELNNDGDDYCSTDCNDTNPLSFPGAFETNDGEDNQCPGDPGHGLVDELSGEAGFVGSSFCWQPQPGATAYEVALSQDPTFSSGCTLVETEETCLEGARLPGGPGLVNLLVRAAAPFAGSWGANDAGEERLVVCP